MLRRCNAPWIASPVPRVFDIHESPIVMTSLPFPLPSSSCGGVLGAPPLPAAAIEPLAPAAVLVMLSAAPPAAAVMGMVSGATSPFEAAGGVISAGALAGAPAAAVAVLAG